MLIEKLLIDTSWLGVPQLILHRVKVIPMLSLIKYNNLVLAPRSLETV